MSSRHEKTPLFRELAAELGELVSIKNAAYGDSFGSSGAIMRLLYPGGVPPEALEDALAIVRVLDKLQRIATDRDPAGENPWQDIAGYALLSWARREGQRRIPSTTHT